jgi:plastocyanin
LGAALALCLLAPVGSAFAQEADVTVNMVGITFVPTVVHVAPGATVLWTNSSPLAHTVTADDLSFDSGSIDPESTFSMAFDAPGTYQYFCAPHGAPGLVGMAATIIVDDPAAMVDPAPAETADTTVTESPRPLPTPNPNPAEYYPDH